MKMNQDRKSWSPVKDTVEKRVNVDFALHEDCIQRALKEYEPIEPKTDAIRIKILELKVGLLNGFLNSALFEKHRFSEKYENCKIDLMNADQRESRWKDKYYEAKNPEVIRKEIEKYDKFVPDSFKADETLIEAKVGAYAKNEERRRQKFDHMLNHSSHDFLISLRECLVIYWVEHPFVLKIGASKEAKKYAKKLRAILREYYENPDNPNEVGSKINFIYEHADIENTRFEEVIMEGPRNDDSFAWLRSIFEKYAVRVADMHRQISQLIHDARYESDDQVPDLTNVLGDTKYDPIIKILMNDIKQIEKNV